jgi:Ca-activated chloride channel homolog
MRTITKRLSSLVLAFVVGAGGLFAQSQDDVIRTETDVTLLPFTVTDNQRRYVTTLRSADLTVLEDGVPQKLFTFQRETDRALSLAFLIDVSQSQATTLTDQKAAVRQFIEKVFDSRRDELTLIPFTGQAFLELPMTRDVIKAYRVLEQVEVGYPSYQGAGRPIAGLKTGPGLPGVPDEGRTAIWDAVGLTASEVLARNRGQRRRAIILLTDGLNNETRIDKKEAIKRTLAAEAIIYAIGVGDDSLCDSVRMPCGVDKDALREVAEKTGGRAFFPKKGTDLNSVFDEIQDELRTQYMIAYSSTNKERDGSYRRIAIEISNPELKKQKLSIRHRPGYFAARGN